MKIIIYQNREVYKENSKIGNDSENKVETLEFEFPEEYADFTKYIEFQIKGGKYVDLIEGNKYVITREVAKYGKIKTQIVLKKNIENDVMVFKSDIFTLNVSNSINATENLVYTVGVDLIEKIVTKNSEQDVRLDALEADNIINKSNISNIQTEQTNQNNRLDSLELDNTTNKTDILNIKQEQITQNTNIQELQTDNTSNKSKIADLETKNAEQDTNIQKNTDDIAEINAKNTAQDEEIAQLKEKDTTQDELIEQLQAENTKLKKEINSMQIPGKATGNPIHLSDSSDMECEIVVKGNAEQETRSGKNKLNFDSLFGNADFITKNSDGTYSITGDGQAHFMLKDVSIPSNNNIFSLDYNKNSNLKYSESGNLIAFNVVYEDGTSEWISLIKDTDSINTRISRTPTNNKNIVKLQLQTFTRFTGGTITFSNVQVASDDVYEPYGASPSPDYPSPVKTVGQNGSVEIEVCNENLFNKNTVTPGYLVPSTGIVASAEGIYTSDFIRIDSSERYYLPARGSIRGKYFDKDKRLVNPGKNASTGYDDFNSSADGEAVINNIPERAKYIRFSLAESYLESYYMRKGENATNFIPHESYTKVLPIQKEFVKIGDVEDTFVKVNGKWYEKHYIGKRIFDGTGGWQIGSSSTDDYYIFQTTITNALNNNTTVNEIYCEQFIYDELQGVAVKDYENIALNSTSHNLVRIWIKASRLTAKSLTAFKTWLSNNNVTVYYVLAEPELIPCTPEQEEILNSFYTYKGITNISVDGIATLKVNYKKDLETLFNNINSALLS